MIGIKSIAITLCFMIMSGALSEVAGADKPQSTKTYIAEKEIAFEMNSATGFVHVPADYNWVKSYSLGEMNSPVVRNKINVHDRNYRFVIGVEELRKLCGNGARRLPIKSKIIDVRSKKVKPFHITRLMVRFRSNGGADVQINGYIFDK